jgi:hypothetical protein
MHAEVKVKVKVRVLKCSSQLWKQIDDDKWDKPAIKWVQLYFYLNKSRYSRRRRRRLSCKTFLGQLDMWGTANGSPILLLPILKRWHDFLVLVVAFWIEWVHQLVIVAHTNQICLCNNDCCATFCECSIAVRGEPSCIE